MAIKNLVYGCRAPFSGANNVRQQMFLAHKYKNRLIELELTRRKAADACVCKLSPEFFQARQNYVLIDEEIKSIYDEIRSASAKARKKIPPTDDMKARLKSARERRKVASESLKSLSKAAYDLLKQYQKPHWDKAEQETPKCDSATEYKANVKAAYLESAEADGLDAGEADYERDKKLARKQCSEDGLYWGSYLISEEACSNMRVGTPPSFKRWEGHGVAGVQLQGGLTVAKALDCEDSRLQLNIPNLEDLCLKGKLRGKRSVGYVKFRIGSDRDNRNKPIFAEVGVTFHRPLPSNGVIKYAYLHKTRVGTHERWQLRLTTSFPDQERVINPDAKGKTVAVHPGWRLMDGRALRVAVWHGSDGRSGDLLLHPRHVSGYAIPDELESRRDLLMNSRMPAFMDWYDANRESFPEWFLEITENIGQWQSQSRFRQLAQHWFGVLLARVEMTREEYIALPKQRYPHMEDSDLSNSAREKIFSQAKAEFPGELKWFKYLWHWRRGDRYYLEWSACMRRKVALRRKDIYRCAAKKLASQYEFVSIADVNWLDAMGKAEPDESDLLTSKQRNFGRLASPGQLVQFTKEAFGSDKVILTTSKRITIDCHNCGATVVNTEEDRRNLMHRCHECGRLWDQDINGAMNQLKRALHGESDKAKGPVKKKVARNNRRQAQKKPTTASD